MCLAQRDTVLTTPPVCPTPGACLNELTHHHTFRWFGLVFILVLFKPHHYKIPMGTQRL